jgi:quercetin dioxygenase-like cupin family protein
MSNYTKINLTDVEDLAPRFGMDSVGEARPARAALGCETIGLAYYKVKPGQRVGFGHRHDEVEEVYLVLDGSGRFRIDDEIIDVSPRDVVRVPPDAMREWEAGDGGLEMVAFGGHSEAEQVHMERGWWID